MSKFKVGDKVRIVGSDTFRGQLRVIHGVTDDDRYLTTSLKEDGTPATQYDSQRQASDFELVTEGTTKVEQTERRTFMLKVESPSLLKGALVQDRCDDGTQPYDLINAETHSKDPSFTVSFAKRELVENAPKFWVEVFKVTPAYMTREELDAFEQFKAQNKKRVTKARIVTAPTKVNGSKHLGHASPQKPAVYISGTARLSRERMEEYLKLQKQGYSDVVIADGLGVKPNTITAYRSIAKKNGLL